MTDRKLEIAFWNYDRTRKLADDSVKIDGVNATFHSARIVSEIFAAMVRRRAYDVSELGLTYLLRTFVDGVSPFLAIPVFPVRSFRHGAIYINKASGIGRPEDLVDHLAVVADQDTAGLRPVVAVQAAHQGGFAGTRGPGQHHTLTRSDIEIDAGQHLHQQPAAQMQGEAFRQPPGAQHDRHAFSTELTSNCV